MCIRLKQCGHFFPEVHAARIPNGPPISPNKKNPPACSPRLLAMDAAAHPQKQAEPTAMTNRKNSASIYNPFL
jgi:hypothetical protein